VKCAYPTASPDVTATTKVVWSDIGTAANTVIGTHRYRGGPFAIDAADKTAALAIINAWNTNTPSRPVFHVVTVHEATAPFTGNVSKEMVAAPTIAVFADGNEDIATGYLRAAGIPQSSGAQFPTNKCGTGTCGPGTVNPDMLTEEAVMGPLGTCSAPNKDHKNGALWRSDGLPAYCQIMSMHWNVSDRETVTCAGGCGTSAAQCNGQAITYHGHEVVGEVRAFLQYPVHFFAECQAVNAYENTVPNPAYPFLDDDGRDGHFLTTRGTPPPCPCASGFSCVNNVCEPTDVKEKGAGFLIATQPQSSEVKVLRPDVPYNQMDGAFGTTGGSEPAYNLSTYLQTTYKNNRQVTLLTGMNGPGDQDVWMSGYLDGACDIILGPPGPGGKTRAGNCNSGKISYLGGHSYATNVPIVNESQTQGTRMFLNALFEADCVTAEGEPSFTLTLTPPSAVGPALPITTDFTVGFANQSAGFAYDGVLKVNVPAGVTIQSATDSGAIASATVSWQQGSISGAPAHPGDPASDGSHMMNLSFAAGGDYPLEVELAYRVGTSTLTTKQTFTVHVGIDSDGDGVSDDMDADPTDPTKCGDTNGDGCDDCATGTFDPNAACPGGNNGGQDSGCCETGSNPVSPFLLGFVVIVLLARRRRMG
jgi:hypothetical protein